MIKPRKKFENIDEYIRTYPPNTQKILEKLRETIKEITPEAVETINYGIPTFKLNGNLVHFAAYKNHIGFYPGSSAIVTFNNELSSYKCTKGTIQFPVDKPIPFDLVRKIVKYRVNENLKREKKKN